MVKRSTEMKDVSKIITSKRVLPIEPAVVLYVTALLLQLPLYQHYLYHRAEQNLNINSSYYSSNCDKNATQSVIKVQREASKYILGVGLGGTFPTIFSSLIYGPLSDRKGRKPTLILPLLGSVIDVAITLVTIYFELPVYWMVIGAVITGLSGKFPTFVFTATAYIADIIKEPSKLALRLTTLEAVSLIGGVIAQATSGLWVKYLGYAAPYWFMFACHLSSLTYTIFFLPESLKSKPENSSICYNTDDLKSTVGIITKQREKTGRFQLNFLLLCSMLLLLPTGVINELIILFAKDQPLCFDVNMIGYFLAALFFARAVGAVSFMKLLKSCLHWQDYSIAQFGCTLTIALLIMIGLSTTKVELFCTTILGLVIGIAQPCIKTIMSQIVSANEQGSLFSITAALESSCNFLVNIAFNPLYRESVKYSWPHANGLVFFINGGIALLALFILSFLKNFDTQRKKYEVLNNDENAEEDSTENTVVA